MFCTGGFGVVTHLWQAMLFGLVAEAAIAGVVIIWFTILQRLVPSELLGRVSSLDWMITIAGVPLSFAAVGPLAEAFGASTTMIWAGVLGGTVTIAAMFIPGARSPSGTGRWPEAGRPAPAGRAPATGEER